VKLHDWLKKLNSQGIILGLERCKKVAKKLNLLNPSFKIISVAGTNGKGSCVALLDSILNAHGYKVGRYTSPHLLRYNERICINKKQISDSQLCASFARIEKACEGILLTSFEFTTLAAMDLFHRAHIDVAILEVGLGGRLDSVNVFDADVALITHLDIDHAEYLGKDIESIALEKAGIFRKNICCVCADSNLPQTLLNKAKELNVNLYYQTRDFIYHVNHNTPTTWNWQSSEHAYTKLPLPNLYGKHQLENANAVLQVINCLSKQLPVSELAIQQGLNTVYLAGRLQVLTASIEIIIDVAHNPSSAKILAQFVQEKTCLGKTYAIVGMLKNKDISNTLKQLYNQVNIWHTVTLPTAESAKTKDLVYSLQDLGAKNIYSHLYVSNAYKHIIEVSKPEDRLIVFGSFYTVAEVIKIYSKL
jgi:dihydrofolate synthase/folylpolyglutamate synthase